FERVAERARVLGLAGEPVAGDVVLVVADPGPRDLGAERHLDGRGLEEVVVDAHLRRRDRVRTAGLPAGGGAADEHDGQGDQEADRQATRNTTGDATTTTLCMVFRSHVPLHGVPPADMTVPTSLTNL